MASKSKQSEGRDRILSVLDALILALGLARDACGVPPAQIAFGSARILLTMIRVRAPGQFCNYKRLAAFLLTLIQDTMVNKQDYVELGKTCAGVCEALNRGLSGRRLDDLSQSVLGAIEKLTT
jgi:hypothetical protein